MPADPGLPRGLRALLACALLDMTAAGLLIPVSSFFAIEELGLGSMEMGSVMSAQAGAALIGIAAIGRLSDSLGRRWPLAACYIWVCVARASFGWVDSYHQLLLASALQGLGSASPALLDSYVLDITSSAPQNRPRSTGLMSACSACACIFGPLLGAVFVRFGLARRQCFYFASALSGFAAIGVLACLPESLIAARRRPLFGGNEGGGDLSIVSSSLVCVWVLRFLCSGAESLMYASYPLLIHDLFGWDDVYFGAVLSVCGLVACGLMLYAFPLMASVFGAARCLCIGCVCGVCAYLLYPVQVIAVHMFALFGFLLNQAFTQPAFPILIGEFAGLQHLGFASGVSTACYASGGVLAPLLAGRLYTLSVSAPYYAAAFVLIVAGCGAGLVHLARPASACEKQPLFA